VRNGLVNWIGSQAGMVENITPKCKGANNEEQGEELPNPMNG
jgi:hypothetical protein